MARLQPTHEPVLCREKFIVKNIKRVYTNKYCGYFFPSALISNKERFDNLLNLLCFLISNIDLIQPS